MFERRNIQRTYLKISREVKDFLLSDKSRELLALADLEQRL